MSVYTPLQRDVLEAFLAPYRLGRLKAFRGITEGTENSNFFVSLEAGEYVLTLVERGEQHDLPFVVALLARLHLAHLPVAFAIPAADGQALRELAGKPALLQPRLPGRHVQQANAQHCAADHGDAHHQLLELAVDHLSHADAHRIFNAAMQRGKIRGLNA